uniref:Uncharacterized protein n=1 Tax=Rhizophora mucronata TaxID=61149 RepID=A0A2P2Q4R6_RHIMU
MYEPAHGRCPTISDLVNSSYSMPNVISLSKWMWYAFCINIALLPGPFVQSTSVFK